MSKKIAPNARFIAIVILLCAVFLCLKAGRTDAVSPAALPPPAITTGCATPVFGMAVNFGVGGSTASVAVGDFNLDGKPDLATANPSSNNVSVLLGNGVGSFAAAVHFGVGDFPRSVAIGDFNLDGRPDLATANNDSANVSVLLGDGMGGFAMAVSFGVGTGPFSVAVGDFNQDGKPDLATANTGPNNVSVLLGDGMGGFAMAVNVGVGTFTFTFSVAVGDFNQDGKPDLTTANSGSANVSVLLNGCNAYPCTSTGFAMAVNFGAGSAPQSVTVGDFNLDGKPDLAAANDSSNNVSVLLGNGMGGFAAAVNFGVGAGPGSVAVGDFNLDGKPDLATANGVSDNVSVLLGDGMGGFAMAVSFGTGTGPYSVAVGDFNLDGKPDLATANEITANVSVLLGNGTGGFAAAVNFGVGGFPRSVAVGDFNLDGKPDLTTTNFTSANVSVLLGNGMGGFAMAVNFGAGSAPQSVTVGDFNLDGKPDLAAANSNSATVSVLLGDGMGGFAMAANFGVGTTPVSVAVGDFNLDGKPDLATANVNSANASLLLNNCTTCATTTLSALANGQAGIAYNETITVTPAGSYTFAVTSGALPPGLALSPAGVLTGTPLAEGVFNFRVTSTGFGTCTGFRDYSLTVVCPTITVNPASLPDGTVGAPYNQSVSASPAGSYAYSVSGGSLPTGLALNSATGQLTGTPTATGTFTFTVTAAVGGCTGSRNYTITITCPVLVITPASLPNGLAGVAYSQALTVTPAGTYSFSIVQGSLPSGTTLNSATGVISGLTSSTGSFTFTVKAATNNGCSGTQAYTLVIQCPTIVVSPMVALPGGTTGVFYSQAFSATPAGGAYTFAVTMGAVPTGLTLNSASGILSGTPTANGTFNFRITATGFGGCTGFRDYTVVVGGGGCPTITLAALPNGKVGTLYMKYVTASPAGSYAYSLTGTLPPGLTFYSAIGLVFGYPTAVGSYNFSITATNLNNCTGTTGYTVAIAP